MNISDFLPEGIFRINWKSAKTNFPKGPPAQPNLLTELRQFVLIQERCHFFTRVSLKARHELRNRLILIWRDQKVDVVRHYNKRVQTCLVMFEGSKDVKSH